MAEQQEEKVVETTEAPAFDMDEAVSDIAEGLGFAQEEDKGPEEPAVDDPSPSEAAPEPVTTETVAESSEASSPETESLPDGEGAPDTWSKGSKEQWKTLPDWAKREIRKREGDVAKGIAQYRDMASVGHAITESIRPFAPYLQRSPVPPTQLIPAALQAYTVMAYGAPEHRVEMFRALARDAGIDLSKLSEEGSAAANTEIAYLQQKIQQLESGVTGVTSEIQASRAAELERKVWEFANDTANHPHFWDVAMDMKRLIDTKAVADLDEAYEKAVWMNPVTRAKEVERSAQALSERAAKEAQQHAREAKKATAVNVKSTGTTRRAAAPLGSLDDTLRETLREIEGRAH